MVRGMGNMGNMQGMMQKMQKMQKDMEKEQKAIEATIFEATDTNNLVNVKVNGSKQVVELTIQEALVDPEDIDMLQDLVIATMNEALGQVDKATAERLGKFTQGLNLPF
ncbi:YbaB/EbfC family nucleoid-associated protein [Aerococcaceae bacterium WGS1372]